MAAQKKWVVEVTGLRQTLDALDSIDVEAGKRIVKEIKAAGKGVANEAKALITGRPISGWGPWIETASGKGRDLSFDPARVARGYSVRKNNFRRRGINAGAGWTVSNSNAGGNIFEVVGDKTRVTDPAGEHMVSAINRRFPQPSKGPRVLLPAYYKGIPENLSETIRDQIIAEARKAGLI